MIGGLNSRRGTILDTEVREDEFTVTAEVSLSDMFGYSSQLRGGTQGKGEFTMEYKVCSRDTIEPARSVSNRGVLRSDPFTGDAAYPDGDGCGVSEENCFEEVVLWLVRRHVWDT